MALIHQETWVRFGTNGIGLSDHQNRYCSGVRIGNWVENEFGDAMQATLQPPEFSGTSTHMADYNIPQTDERVTRATKIGNVSNIDMAHGPEEIRDLTLMTSTYDLAMCHAVGPRRVDTMLWSGVTKVDREVPTAVHSKQSLLEQKKANWAKEKETEWQTAYTSQYQGTQGEYLKQAASEHKVKQASLSKMPRLHLKMGLRDYN